MKVQVYEDELQIGEAAAALYKERVSAKPDSVLGFATGSTPLPTYRALIELCKQGAMDFSLVRTFNLDEYVGIDRSHEQSYYRFMFDNLFSHINIKPENVHVPAPVSDDLDADCAQADHAEGTAGQFEADIGLLPGFDGLVHRGLVAIEAVGEGGGWNDIAGGKEQGADHQFLDGVGVGAGGVEDRDPAGGVVGDRDVVGTGPSPGDR